MTVTIRRISPADVPPVVRMVHELAEYERSADECRLTEDQLHTALFGERPALFGHVAENADGIVGGFVLWFLNFSTWEGVHGIYVEDLYVRPELRGNGVARRFWSELSRECRARGYARIEAWTLDWNAGTIAFHRATGPPGHGRCRSGRSTGGRETLSPRWPMSPELVFRSP